MADVRWIKITTDIFDDEKILLIESLPDADAIITIWFKLLCLAGKMNNGGVFLMNNRIAFTDKMLATIFRRKETTVQLALKTFEEYGMIEVLDGVISIPNWDKHQNIDAMEKMREQTRERVAKYREKQKRIECNVTGNVTEDVTVTLRNATDKNREEKNREEEIRGEKEHIAHQADQKHHYGEFKKVLLTDTEIERLRRDYGISETEKAIEFFDAYIAEKGYKSKSHYLAMRRWVFDAVAEREKKSNNGSNNKPINKTAQELDDFYNMVADWVEDKEGSNDRN